MKRKNRITPFLIITLIILIWILIFVILFKTWDKGILSNEKRIKVNDELIQELYTGLIDEDIKVLDSKDYKVNDLPDYYIVSKATRYMTSEDVNFNNSSFTISNDTLDNAIKMGFGPDIKYDLSKLDKNVTSELYLNDKRLNLSIRYDSINRNYTGSYSYNDREDAIKVYKGISKATKSNTINLYINYVFYKEVGNGYLICENINCDKTKKVKQLDENAFNKKMIISYKKASDDVYYYYSNNIDK